MKCYYSKTNCMYCEHSEKCPISEALEESWENARDLSMR